MNIGEMSRLLRVAGRVMLELVYPQPPRCRLCSRQAVTVDGRGSLGLCSLCHAGLIFLDKWICDICGRELAGREPGEKEEREAGAAEVVESSANGAVGGTVEGGQGGEGAGDGEDAGGGEGVGGVVKICSDCRRRGRKQTFFQANRSAVAYNRMMKDILALYKYRGDERLRALFGELLHQAYQMHYAGLSIDAITYVPLHPRREKERGFNQSRQLAEELGRRVALPVHELLVRKRETDKQSMKSRAERINALRGVFAVQPLVAHFAREGQRDGKCHLLQRQVLLVDDVYTTGSTVNECARVLVESGCEKIYVLTVAR